VKHFPVYLDIQKKKVLVVGGGTIAARKVKSLAACGAKVTVVSPKFCATLARKKGIRRVKRCYRKGDIKDMFLVICATDSPEVNEQVYKHATAAKIPVNVVDKPKLCSFIVPSVVKQGELLIAISTGGGSPALSRQIRELLEDTIDPSFGKHLSLLKEFRPKVKASSLTENQRMRLLKRMASSNVRRTLTREGTRATRVILRQMLSDATAK
jgi:precorrin-2 dehydrogenase/sirohydrochlorin ferrochelatase